MKIDYFIQVENHIDKSTRIVNKITNLDTYSTDFNTIINQLNKDNTLDSIHKDNKVELVKTETVVIPGYIYNSTKKITTIVYSLTLIQSDNTLSELFKHDTPSQTELQDNQTTQTNTYTDSDTDAYADTESEFGEFQKLLQNLLILI